MHRITAATAALLATTAIAHAGGLERDRGSMAILFEEGTYVELSFTHVDPDVSGTAEPAFGGRDSGEVLDSYTFSNLSFRSDITEELSFAVIWAEPYGAGTNYPTGTFYPLAGTEATVDSQQLAVVLRYEMENGFSIFGGVRAVEVEGAATLPAVAGYTLDASGSDEIGYLLGAAFEREDIALRVSVTYQSATEHTFSATETTLLGTAATEFDTTLPQSLTLEAQTGVAEGTLVFGSVRWVDWSEFQIAPTVFGTLTGGGALADNSQDVITYRAGVARRLSDSFVGLASITYEPNGTGSAAGDDFMGNLDPRDGRLGFGVGGRWESESGFVVSGGVEYIMFGDADVSSITAPGTQLATFEDNTGVAVALRIGYRF